MFHHLPCLLCFECKKNVLERTWLQKVIETDFINWALSCSPVWHLGHYSNVFNSKSNVIVTLSEHVDGNFQARCGQRLQSTKSRRPEGNNITMYGSLDERHSKVSTHLHSTTNQKKDMCWCL